MAQVAKLSVTILLFCIVPLFADGRILSMHGKVQVFENGRWAKAELTSKITEASSVQVGYRSAAVVGLTDGSQISLKENTTVSFNHLGVDPAKPRSEIYVVHGTLSAFVKKPEGNTKHVFHVRTPTMIVGVRGSFFEMSKNGEQHLVTAVQSPAFIKADATPSTTRERLQKAFANLERAYIIDREEKRSVGLRMQEVEKTRTELNAALEKISDADDAPAADKQRRAEITGKLAVADADLNALRSAEALVLGSPEARKAVDGVGDHKALQKLLLERQRVLAGELSEFRLARAELAKSASSEKLTVWNAMRSKVVAQMVSVRSLTLLQLSWAEAAYRAELEAYLIAQKSSDKKKTTVTEDDESFLNTIGLTMIPQGDSAAASGDIRGPLTTRMIDTRAQRDFSSGAAATERSFLGNNTDSQAGFGNDVQGLYNSINSVTQPSDTGGPTLQKF